MISALRGALSTPFLPDLNLPCLTYGLCLPVQAEEKPT